MSKKIKYYYKNIKQCRVCGSRNLKEIIKLGKISIPNFGKESQTIKAPLSLVLCKKCTLLQTKQTTNPLLLWNENYGYQSGLNNQMKKELEEIVRKAEKIIKLKKDDVVIDIGCNDGTMLNFYKNKQIKRVGFDPSNNVIKIAEKKLRKYGKNSILINDFFSAKKYYENLKQKAKIITAIAMFYDLDKPNDFLEDVLMCLDKDGIFIIQQNYLMAMLKNNAIDNVVHEHLEYYSLTSLNNLIRKHNLEIFDVEFNQVNGGSFRTYLKIKGATYPSTNSRKIRKAIEKERKNKLNKIETYTKFSQSVQKNLKQLKDFIIEERKKGKKIFIYGASTRGSTIINFLKLNKKIIEKAADKNSFKWGKKISGTDIEIVSEKQARQEKPDYFLILPWYFKEEFIKREKKYLEKGGKLIFPLPKLSIYSF